MKGLTRVFTFKVRLNQELRMKVSNHRNGKYLYLILSAISKRNCKLIV